VLAAIGVDCQGNKHVLGLRQGASENAVVVQELLEDLVARGIRSGGGGCGTPPFPVAVLFGHANEHDPQ